MIREKYQINIVETSLSIVQNRIDSVRKKNITRTGYRVYKNGNVGMYSQLGESEPDPWGYAAENLIRQPVSYPFAPDHSIRQERVIASDLKDHQIMADLERLLEQARKDNPDFILSNKVNVTQISMLLENSLNTRLYHSDKVLSVGILLKHRESASIMDAFLGYRARCWDPDLFTSALNQLTQAYLTPMPFPDKEVLVVAEADLLAGKLISELNGEKVGYKSSLFAGDMGRKVFHDDFSFFLDWNEQDQYHTPFFDAEGTVCPDNRQISLINRGVIEKAYTDKRTADLFNMPLTGSAVCPYDGVPALGAGNFNIMRSEKTLTELLDGRPGVLIAMASGGDYTEEGKFATPVQLAFLTDGKKLLGRLPEFNVSGNLYDLFGRDYIGFSSDRFWGGEPMLVVKMKT